MTSREENNYTYTLNDGPSFNIINQVQPIGYNRRGPNFSIMSMPASSRGRSSMLSLYQQYFLEVFLNSGYDNYYLMKFKQELRKGILNLKAENARNMIGDNFYEQIQYYNTSRLKGWIRKAIRKGRIPRSTGYLDKVLERLEARAKSKLDNDFKYKPEQKEYYPVRYHNKNRLRNSINNKKDIYKHNYYDKCK